MSSYYDKEKLKRELTIDNIYDLLVEFGGDPEITSSTSIVSSTICHNLPGEGSHKLYYYENDDGIGLFHCYTGCESSFDIFQLVIKVMKIQRNKNYELYDAMDYVARYFGLSGEDPVEDNEHSLKDWSILQRYADLATMTEHRTNPQPQLKQYDPVILSRLIYPRIAQWEDEGISRGVCLDNLIGYYPTMEQITVPHFDINNRFVGLRGRYLGEEQAARYGKYRPLVMGRTTYKHPLSMNLYHLNKSKEAISAHKAAIVYEGEKSCLLSQTYYGKKGDISVACCGSSLSSFQVQLLRDLGAEEIIIAFDRQFQKLGDEEFKRLTKKLIAINNKYGHYVKITTIFDKDMITGYKSSPIDEGIEKFEYLLNNRFIPR